MRMETNTTFGSFTSVTLRCFNFDFTGYFHSLVCHVVKKTIRGQPERNSNRFLLQDSTLASLAGPGIAHWLTASPRSQLHVPFITGGRSLSWPRPSHRRGGRGEGTAGRAPAAARPGLPVPPERSQARPCPQSGPSPSRPRGGAGRRAGGPGRAGAGRGQRPERRPPHSPAGAAGRGGAGRWCRRAAEPNRTEPG